jgi:hypothetical protein
MYIPQNWEFGSALAKLRNFVWEEGLTPHPSVRRCVYRIHFFLNL